MHDRLALRIPRLRHPALWVHRRELATQRRERRNEAQPDTRHHPRLCLHEREGHNAVQQAQEAERDVVAVKEEPVIEIHQRRGARDARRHRDASRRLTGHHRVLVERRRGVVQERSVVEEPGGPNDGVDIAQRGPVDEEDGPVLEDAVDRANHLDAVAPVRGRRIPGVVVHLWRLVRVAVRLEHHDARARWLCGGLLRPLARARKVALGPATQLPGHVTATRVASHDQHTLPPELLWVSVPGTVGLAPAEVLDARRLRDVRHIAPPVRGAQKVVLLDGRRRGARRIRGPAHHAPLGPPGMRVMLRAHHVLHLGVEPHAVQQAVLPGKRTHVVQHRLPLGEQRGALWEGKVPVRHNIRRNIGEQPLVHGAGGQRALGPARIPRQVCLALAWHVNVAGAGLRVVVPQPTHVLAPLKHDGLHSCRSAQADKTRYARSWPSSSSWCAMARPPGPAPITATRSLLGPSARGILDEKKRVPSRRAIPWRPMRTRAIMGKMAQFLRQAPPPAARAAADACMGQGIVACVMSINGLGEDRCR